MKIQVNGIVAFFPFWPCVQFFFGTFPIFAFVCLFILFPFLLIVVIYVGPNNSPKKVRWWQSGEIVNLFLYKVYVRKILLNFRAKVVVVSYSCFLYLRFVYSFGFVSSRFDYHSNVWFVFCSFYFTLQFWLLVVGVARE